MQAHINALMRSDEFIMESLITFDKIKIMIYQLLVSEVWKSKVYPLVKERMLQISSFRSYMAVPFLTLGLPRGLHLQLAPSRLLLPVCHRVSR